MTPAIPLTLICGAESAWIFQRPRIHRTPGEGTQHRLTRQVLSDCLGLMHPAVLPSALFVVIAMNYCAAAEGSWQTHEGFRSRSVQPSGNGDAGFTEMDPTVTSITFTNVLVGDAYLTNAVAHNGAGVALGDVDGDGWVDIYLCNLQGANRLYRNNGNWSFAELALGPAACAEQLSTAANFADVDGDDDLDLLVNGVPTGTRLFLNDGRGNWSEQNSGLSQTAAATSMALADFEGDGDLDLYCTHYVDVMYMADPTTRFGLARRGDKWEVNRINGQSASLPKWKGRFEVLPNGKVRELGEVDGFYLNDGRGNFKAVDWSAGTFLSSKGEAVSPPRDWGLAVMFRDLNGDGAPDLYVCNDMPSPDRIWFNSGQGTFRAMEPFVMRHTSRSSMGLDIADVDRDGRDDIFVVDMLAREPHKRLTQLVRDMPDPMRRELVEEEPAFNRNMLFYSRGDGTYSEGALMAGVAASDWSWCPAFVDVDLDGFEDILVTNGFEFDVMDKDSHELIRTGKFSIEQLKRIRQLHSRWRTENAAFRNRGDGTFEPAGKVWNFNKAGVSYGMALGDLDNDGDLDVVVNNLNDRASIYRNNSDAPRIAIRLKGRAPNTRGIGAKVRITGLTLNQSQEMISGGRYMSGDEALRVFAVPRPSEGMSVEVIWRDGLKSSARVQANHIYELQQGLSEPSREQKKEQPVTLFAEIAAERGQLNEPRRADVSPLKLLPWRVDDAGAGVVCMDFDADGWEDLVVGGGASGIIAYKNIKGTNFQILPGSVNEPREEMGAFKAWMSAEGGAKLLIPTSQKLRPQIPVAPVFVDTSSALSNGLPGLTALGDIDGDGDLDLFVAAGHKSGRYPEHGSSAIWLNKDGIFQESEGTRAIFQSAGMITGAVLSDLDGDGAVDLVVATEWGPVRIYRNDKGAFKEITSAVGLEERRGWWMGLCTGDFNGDGKIDLAVGNRGRNSEYELDGPGPVRLYYGDWDKDGRLELLEARRTGSEWVPTRNRTFLEEGFPGIAERFKTHEAFARSTVRDILGDGFDAATFLEATTFESGVLLNMGETFKWVPLPREAQMSSISGLIAGDVNGDGVEDLFASQNFYGINSDITRDDNGRGLILLGKGDGTFTPMSALQSGIKIEGEQRGAAFCDFDQDGRLDFAVAEGRGVPRIFRNQSAIPGRRVVLRGPVGNRTGVGAQVRLEFSDGSAGPAREVSGGTGYWSQNGSVQMVTARKENRQLRVRWPGGVEQVMPVPAEAGELVVTYPNANE